MCASRCDADHRNRRATRHDARCKACLRPPNHCVKIHGAMRCRIRETKIRFSRVPLAFVGPCPVSNCVLQILCGALRYCRPSNACACSIQIAATLCTQPTLHPVCASLELEERDPAPAALIISILLCHVARGRMCARFRSTCTCQYARANSSSTSCVAVNSGARSQRHPAPEINSCDRANICNDPRSTGLPNDRVLLSSRRSEQLHANGSSTEAVRSAPVRRSPVRRSASLDSLLKSYAASTQMSVDWDRVLRPLTKAPPRRQPAT